MEIYTYMDIFSYLIRNTWKKKFRRVKYNGEGLNSSLRR